MSVLANSDVIRAWGAGVSAAEAFGEEGDFAHQYLLNPAIFAMPGNVTGKQLLDAGCGQGYLSRLLARRGAHVTGIEPTEGFYQIALQREEAKPLGISYLQQDLSTFT